jgi:hypothetical protein
MGKRLGFSTPVLAVLCGQASGVVFQRAGMSASV